jgi:apolipoprotein N-acyltransferase
MFQSAAEPAMSIPQRIILCDGWTRRLTALASGAVGALALAPLNIAPAMAVMLTVSVWLIDGAPAGRSRLAGARAAAATGWWVGFGYFLAGLWWLGAAMLVEADQFAWALPLAVIGLPAALALFTSLGFGIARLLWSPGSGRIFALAAGLGGAEWLRGHVLTGFPWNNIGMSLAAVPPFAQGGAWVGLYGLDILAVLIFAAPATLIDERRNGRLPMAAQFAIALTVALFSYGALRLATARTEFVPDVKLRLMQPNLPQDAKFNPENGPEILRRYLALSDQATGPEHSGILDATHVIWPESAFPFVLSREPRALTAISRAMRGKVLITGAARAEEGGAADHSARRTKIFNAIEVLQDGRILAFYDKTHLVPFGEYLPLDALLGPLGITHLVPGVWDRGAGPKKLNAPGLPLVAPLVCYEIIFPGQVLENNSRQRPEWLLNLTNDGWFGATSGPYQHMAQARLRAIEEGLPLVRVANTGISAIVDPYGRVIQDLPLGVEGVIDGRLPKPAPAPFFSKFGDSVFFVLWGAVLLCAGTAKFWLSRRVPR